MWGQTEQALRDTLVHKAERKALEELGVKYGFTRPRSEISEVAYRSGFIEAAYAKRGTKLSMFDVIEGALSDYNTTYARGIYKTALPHQLSNPYPTEWATSAATLAELFVYRLIRTEYGVHMVIRTEYGVAVAGVGASCAVLHLAPVTHTFYGPFEPVVDLQTQFFLLPFVLRERIPGPIDDDLIEWATGLPCVAEISLTEATLPDIPPTYLLAGGLTPTPVGPPAMPFGGQLLEGPHVDGNPMGAGPHPFYLYDGLGFSGLQLQLQRLMVLGTFIRIIHDP